MGAFLSSVIHSVLRTYFNSKFFPKLTISKNPYAFPHRRARDGVIGWMSISSSDSFRFCQEHSSSEDDFRTQKLAKYAKFHYEGLFFPEGARIGRSATFRSSVIYSGFLHIFQLKNVFRDSKNSESTRKTIRGLLWSDQLDPELRLFSGVSGTSVPNFRSPAQSARLWPFLVISHRLY